MRTREAAWAVEMPEALLYHWSKVGLIAKPWRGSGHYVEWSETDVAIAKVLWALHCHLTESDVQDGGRAARIRPMLTAVVRLLADGIVDRWLYIDSFGPLLVGDEGLPEFLAVASGAFHLIDLHKVAA